MLVSALTDRLESASSKAAVRADKWRMLESNENEKMKWDGLWEIFTCK